MQSYSTCASILEDLKVLGIQPGDGVFVHASMKSIGATIGGPRAVVQALLDHVGKDGLIAMPGFSNDAYLPTEITLGGDPDAESDRVARAVLGFDLAKSSAREMGAIAETFRTWPGTLRSSHPTTSVCLNGFKANEFAAEHSLAWAMGEHSPFGKLYQRQNTKILLIGVGWDRCTALHTAETFAEIKRLKVRRFKHGGIDGDWMETPDVADDLGRLFPAVGRAFEKTGSANKGMLGSAHCKVCGFRDLVDFARDWINQANVESGDRS